MPNPAVPIEYAELKRQCRAGLDSQESRQFWWPALPSVNPNSKNIDSLPDAIETAERLSSMLKEPLLDHSAVPNKGENPVEQVVRKISYVLINQNKLEDIEVSYFVSLIRLIVWQLGRVDVSYYTCAEIVNNPERFGRPGPSNTFAMYYTFRELLKTYMPNTFSALKTIGALDDKYLSMMFVDYFAEILPSTILLPLLDAYLLEGTKVLYRFGLALICGYKSAIKGGEFANAKEFWLAVKSDSFAVTSFNGTAVVTKLLSFDEVLPTVDQFVVFEHAKNQDFLNSNAMIIVAFDSERSFLQKASKPMKISRSNLATLKRQAAAIEPPEMKTVYAHRQAMVNNRSSSITGKMMEGGSSAQQTLSRKQSLRNPSSQNNSPNPNNSASGTNRKSANVASPVTAMTLQQELDAQVIPPSQLIASHSCILDVTNADKLLSCLPSPYNNYQYELRFATYQSGWDISSLYARIERYESCIFIFHLQSPYDDFVIGAFNHGPVSPPNQQLVRGDGKTSRIFKLEEEKQPTYYTWVYAEKDDDELDALGRIPNIYNQFAVSTTTSLTFGGSHIHSCNAIRLDSDLRTLHTGPSDTYGNKSALLMNKQTPDSVVQSFDIKEIEIFCAAANRHVVKE